MMDERFEEFDVDIKIIRCIMFQKKKIIVLVTCLRLSRSGVCPGSSLVLIYMYSYLIRFRHSPNVHILRTMTSK